MNFINQADIRVAHLQSTLKFGRQQALKTSFGKFQRYSLVALQVEGFIHDAHSTLAYFSHNFESFRDDLTGAETTGWILKNHHRMQQEPAHAFFPRDRIRYLAVEIIISLASDAQVGFTFRRRLLKNRRHNLHDTIVLFGACHGLVLSRSNSQRRDRYHSRCKVCNVRFSAPAASVSVNPRKNFNSTTARFCCDSISSSSSSRSTVIASSSAVW